MFRLTLQLLFDLLFSTTGVHAVQRMTDVCVGGGGGGGEGGGPPGA
jgi:hypothetical protein